MYQKITFGGLLEHVFTSQIPFPSPNQQCQTTEGTRSIYSDQEKSTSVDVNWGNEDSLVHLVQLTKPGVKVIRPHSPNLYLLTSELILSCSVNWLVTDRTPHPSCQLFDVSTQMGASSRWQSVVLVVTAQMKGVLRVIAKPLVGRIPIVAGVSLCFLEQPVSGVCF